VSLLSWLLISGNIQTQSL
jgi:thiamine kinase-like enzyme